MKQLLHARTIQGAVRPLELSEPYIYADREKQGRSGHLGHGLVEFAPGKIIDFAPNCSAQRLCGHAAFGWMEYRISEDYGRTYSRPRKLPYSWETFLNGNHTVSVEKAVASSDGSVTAFCLINSTRNPISCEPWDVPQRIRSEDGGKTWSEPAPVGSWAGRIYAALEKDGVIYALEFCNDAEKIFLGNKPEHLYRIFVSKDRGVTFEEKCVVPFPDTLNRGYGAMIFTPAGELMVYAYNAQQEDVMDVMISPDCGDTWLPCRKSRVAKNIRNPQIAILKDQYIIHGRAGENDPVGRGKFVLYTSANGLDWDEGTILSWGRSACFYSNNLLLCMPDGSKKLLIQYSENYADPVEGEITGEKWSGRVNTMHLWLE